MLERCLKEDEHLFKESEYRSEIVVSIGRRTDENHRHGWNVKRQIRWPIVKLFAKMMIHRCKMGMKSKNLKRQEKVGVYRPEQVVFLDEGEDEGTSEEPGEGI